MTWGMRHDTLYVFNYLTSRMCKADSSAGRVIVKYPHCSVRPDLKAMRVSVSTPAHNLVVKYPDHALQICKAYYANSDQYYALVEKYALPQENHA